MKYVFKKPHDTKKSSGMNHQKYYLGLFIRLFSGSNPNLSYISKA
jgi:hypothetical protein